MAKSTRTTTRVPKPAEYVEQVEIVLTLSMREAQTLRDVCARIGGDADTSRRRYTDSIGRALNRAGVNYHFSPADLVPTSPMTANNIYFRYE